MEPISIIVAALSAGALAVGAGAGEGLKSAAQDAITSLYGRLKASLAQKGEKQEPMTPEALERHSLNPEAYEALVRDLIKRVSLDSDGEILDLAQRLLEAADPDGAKLGKYQVSVSGGQVGAIGDNASVSMNFDRRRD